MKDQNILKKRKSFLLITLLLFTTLLSFKIFKKVNIEDISIYGSEFFSKDDIAANSSLKFPTPLILIKTKYAEKELKKNLSLENVSVFRQILPFGLKILIKTRTPIAYGEKIINEKNITGFVDEDGFFIKEKYSDKKFLKKISSKVFGWNEKFRERLSKILNFQKDNEVEFVSINFSSNGFLTLEEKSLKIILLGLDPEIIETQLHIISNLKKQLIGKNILGRIDNIDLTEPNNPKIKVFKP